MCSKRSIPFTVIDISKSMQHIEVPDINPPPLFSSMGFYSWNIKSWCATKPLHIFHWSSSMCNYINHFILFFSAQAIIWLVWSNSFLLFFQFFIHCSRMGICTSLITIYTTLGCFCYLLGFHLCNIFTLMVSNYYKL